MTKKTRTRKRSCASSIAKFLEAKNSLKEILRPGDSISVHLNSVSSSGMTRHLTFLIARIDGNGIPFIWNITRLVAKATGLRYNDKKEDLVVGGCGMDMGFAVVYDLGRAMFPDGVPCAGRDCHSNDHANGDRDYTTSKIHKDGGYAFRKIWI